jgi:aminoglycoside phosphotransferase (APT) family kinase protein
VTGQPAAGDPFQLLAGLRDLAAAPAAQVETVIREVRARREQIAAFQAQLSTLDEQLAALEAALQPLVEWSRSWAAVQRTLLGPLLPPPADPGSGD